MKRFLRKILLFILSFYLVAIAILLVSKALIQANSDFSLNDNITSLVVGNSQSECAYDDSIIPNFINLSKSAETYFYSYQKLKETCAQNNQIKTLIVAFSSTNVLAREDEKIWETPTMNYHLPNLYTFLSKEDYMLLIRNNFLGFHQVSLESITQSLSRITKNNYRFTNTLGDYKNIQRSKITRILDTLKVKKLQQHKLSQEEIATYDLKYLRKIITLAHDHDIEVFLVRSPVHKNYKGRTYNDSFEKIRKERFDDVQFVDFQNFELTNQEFGDLQHLNNKGAQKYSKVFADWLTKSRK